MRAAPIPAVSASISGGGAILNANDRLVLDGQCAPPASSNASATAKAVAAAVLVWGFDPPLAGGGPPLVTVVTGINAAGSAATLRLLVLAGSGLFVQGQR